MAGASARAVTRRRASAPRRRSRGARGEARVEAAGIVVASVPRSPSAAPARATRAKRRPPSHGPIARVERPIEAGASVRATPSGVASAGRCGPAFVTARCRPWRRKPAPRLRYSPPGPLAQLVEHRAFNPWVRGSSPRRPTSEVEGLRRLVGITIEGRDRTGPSGAAELREGQVLLLLSHGVRVDPQRDRRLLVAPLLRGPAHALARAKRPRRPPVARGVDAQRPNPFRLSAPAHAFPVTREVRLVRRGSGPRAGDPLRRRAHGLGAARPSAPGAGAARRTGRRARGRGSPSSRRLAPVRPSESSPAAS